MWGLSGHPLASTLQVTSFTQASVGRDQRLYDPSFLRSTHACCWFSQWRRALIFKNAQDIRQMGNGSEKCTVPDGHVVPYLILIPATVI